MSGIHWVKLSTAMFDDEKIKAIEAMPSGTEMCLIWIQLILLAGKVNDHGLIYISEDVPYNDATLAHSTGHSVETVRLALTTFKRMGMIDILSNDRIALVNWEKHQSIDRLEVIKERDRLRKRRVRAHLKLLGVSGDCPGTSPAEVHESPSADLDLDLDSDSEEEKKELSSPTAQTKLDAIVGHGVVRKITDYFQSLYAEEFPGFKPTWDGKTIKLVKSDIARMGDERLGELIQLFFEEPPSFVTKNETGLGYNSFHGQIDSLIMKKTRREKRGA